MDKWFRVIAKHKYTDSSSFLSTDSAKNALLYRWNEQGYPALYLADSRETAIAEVGRYFLGHAQRFNETTVKKKGLPKDESLIYFKKIKKEFVIAEVEIEGLPAASIRDLRNHKDLLDEFQRLGFTVTINDVLIDSIIRDKARPYQKFASLQISNKVSALIVPSARKQNACCKVIYIDNCRDLKMTVKDVKDVTFSLLDTHGNPPKKVSQLDETTFQYEIEDTVRKITPTII